MEEKTTITKLQDQLEATKLQLQQVETELAAETVSRDKAEIRLKVALSKTEKSSLESPDSEQLYQQLVEQTHDIVYSVTPEGIITYLGPQLTHFGYSPQELISKNFIEFVAPEQRQEVIHKFQTGTTAGESFPTEFQWINKDGSRTWIEVVGKTVFDDAGKPEQQIGVIRVIEDRKKQDEEKENLLLLLDTLDGECFIKDKAGTYQYINKAFETQFGVKREEVIGQDDTFVFGAETAKVLQENDQRIMASKKPEAVEESTYLQDGKFVVYLTNKTPIFDEDGEVVGICGVGVDITHQKKVEEQLRQSEERFRMLVENSHDVMYTVGADGIIKYMDVQIAQYGYSSEEVVGNNVLQFIAPETREESWRTFQELVKSGESTPVRLQWLQKDGKRQWVEVVANTVYDDSGTPVERVGIMRNISYQMEIEDQLRQSEEKYRSLVEQISEVIYSVDLDGVITYINPAIEPFLGFSPDEVIGQPIKKFVVPEELSNLDTNFQRVSSGVTLEPNEYMTKTKSGETRWMRTSSRPIMEGDHVLGVQGILIDITNRKMSEAQLTQAAASAERERLARELHDSVTQTLYSVAAIAEALPHIWERDQEQARTGLGELTTLTNAALAEMRTLLLELRPETLKKQNLPELLYQLGQGLLGRTRMEMNMDLDEDCSLPVDTKIALYRITQEALNNINKHARASSAQIDLDCEPGLVKLLISDNGVGFNPQSISQHRLGLDIMRERAQDIGAQFDIKSQADQGTSISVIWQER